MIEEFINSLLRWEKHDPPRWVINVYSKKLSRVGHGGIDGTIFLRGRHFEYKIVSYCGQGDGFADFYRRRR